MIVPRLHSSYKPHVSNNLNVPYYRPLLKDFITTFVINIYIYHLTGEILTFKKEIPKGKKSALGK